MYLNIMYEDNTLVALFIIIIIETRIPNISVGKEMLQDGTRIRPER